jgi:hypothetical protein
MARARESTTKKDDTSKRQLTLRKLEALAQSTTHGPEAQTARAKAEELKIHHEIVQVAPATERDPGVVTEGHWFLENGDTVVICDRWGEPKRHRDIPTRVVPLPDQTARQVARRLIRDMYVGDPGAGFYRKLRYPSGAAPV